MTDSGSRSDAPGWDAIDRALAKRYGDQVPVHMSYTPGVELGGGLDGCSAFDAGDHWHYVTYGLTELYAKDSDDAAVSGWGYELTMRVRREAGDEPPTWPFTLLERLASYTSDSGKWFEAGHRMSPGGPITGTAGTRLTALAFILDPALDAIDSPNGRLAFLQAVGITETELDEMKASSTQVVLERWAVENPLLITDPSR